MISSTLLPTFVLFILTAAAITTTVVVLESNIRSNRLAYQDDYAKMNENLSKIQNQQSSYANQVATLTTLVKESLNATDEYINNITSTVADATQSINADMATVQDIQDNQSTLMAVQFAGMFTILVILVSGYHLSQHLRHMHLPVVQRKIMAVLWMTPIYSMSSWLSLVFESAEPYLAVIREFYESYCVYMFFSFLIAVLGRGDRQAVITLLEIKANTRDLPKIDKCRCGPKFWKRCWTKCCNNCGKRRRVPTSSGEVSSPRLVDSENATNTISRSIGDDDDNNTSSSTGLDISVPNNLQGQIDEYGNYVSPDRVKAEAVLDQCQMYAMQFVLLRPITAIGWLIANLFFEPTQFADPTCPQLYITIITNMSIFFAFRGLVRFYHATRSNLAWCNPWPKFLCIKGVVFMTFWQKMTIGLIVNVGYADKFDSQEKANDFIMQAQNFLICLEMLFSAVAHCFVFSPDEWAEGYREREEERRRRASSRAFGDSVALGDFINDVKIVMASKKRRKRRKRVSDGGGGTLSPSSTMEEDEGNNTLDLSLSTSDDGNDRNLRSINEAIQFQTTPSPKKSANNRRRLDTAESVDSEGDDIDEMTRMESLSRIEQFINGHHTPKPSSNDNKELV